MAGPDSELKDGTYNNGFRRKELEVKFLGMAERFKLLQQIPPDFLTRYESNKTPWAKENQEVAQRVQKITQEIESIKV